MPLHPFLLVLARDVFGVSRIPSVHGRQQLFHDSIKLLIEKGIDDKCVSDKQGRCTHGTDMNMSSC